MIRRGAIHWADLGEPRGSRPTKRRPVLVIQNDSYSASRLSTVLVTICSSNTTLATMPGNVFLPAVATGLPRDSVVNVTGLLTLNKAELDTLVGRVPENLMHDVDMGLRKVLSL